MNYAGSFGAAFSPTHSHHAYVHVDSSQVHAPAGALIVPDAQLLFHADYKRSGSDLILSRDDHQFVLHDYFRGDKRAALASPDGAHLTADIVKALVGEVDVAQAGNTAAASQVIGHVTKLQGSATIIRNGVAVILNMGDNVEKGDVVQSGANSTLGITFIDGTVFGLGANARMVLNEMVYDPNGSNNSSLLSLVAGTITFVAGETAKHGDMKVDTPVATMGIRGTAVLVEIDFSVPGQNGAPNASFQVLVEPDGSTGSYILFDKTTLQPLAIVNQAGQQININNGVLSQTTVPLSPEIQKLINDVFQQKFTDNSTTKTTTASTDSIIPTSTGLIIKLADGTTATAFFQNVNANTESTTTTQQSPTVQHVSGTLTLQSVGLSQFPQLKFATSEIPGITGDRFDPDHVGGILVFSDANTGDRPTVTADFTSLVYSNANGSFTISNGQASAPGLSALQFADIYGIAIKLLLVPDAGNTNNGRVTWLYSVPDNAFDFLAAGETLTLTYHVTVNSNFGPGPEMQTLDITIVVTGTNDRPVFTTGGQTITFGGATGGDLPTKDPLSGTLAFNDVDLTDKHTVSTKLTGAAMSNGDAVPQLPEHLLESALTASIAIDSTGTGNGVVNWHYADLPAFIAELIRSGETLTLTYKVTVTDSQGATAEQTITVVITGTEAAAEIWIHTANDGNDNLWTTAANWKTGHAPTSTDDVIIINDPFHSITPFFPVLIGDGTAAVANSVTMTDFAHLPPELDIAGGASLTISAAFNISVDSILRNAGILTVGGKFELLDSLDQNGNLVSLNQSVVVNSGTIKLGQGGDIEGLAGITNTGTIDLQGGRLNVLVHMVNSGEESNGRIVVEEGAVLALGTDSNNSGVSGGIVGGTVTVHGELDLQGSDFLTRGTLDNNGRVNVGGTGNSLDGERISNFGAIEVLANGALLLDLNTAITGAGTITVDALATLTINGATIAGGILTLDGLLNATGISSIDGATITVDLGGTLESTGGTLTIDPAEPATLTNAGTVEANGGELDITTELVINTKELKAINGGTLKLTSTSVTNTGGTVSDTSGSTIDLISASISGGFVTLDGLLNATGISSIDGATITVDLGGTLESTGGTLTIDPAEPATLTNAGTVEANGGELDITTELVINTKELKAINGGTLKLTNTTVMNAGGAVTVDHTSTLDLITASIIGGTLGGGGNIETAAGNTDSTLNGVTLASGTTVTAAAGELDLTGTINAAGAEIDVNSGAGISLDLENVTLNGGTLGGSGKIGTAAGNIDSTLNGVTIASGTTVTAAVGELDLTGTINAAGAEIDANSGAGISLDLENVTLEGGTLGGKGKIGTAAGNTDSTLNGVTLASGTTVTAAAGELDLTGTINAAGAEIDSNSGSGISLDLENVTLKGGTLGGKGRIGTAAGNTVSTLNGVTIASGTTVTAAVGELDLTGVINAAGAEIDANSGSGISLDLENVTLEGGTLGGKGKIGTAAGNTVSTLNGVTLASGTIVTAAVGELDLTGTINAAGAEIDSNSGAGISLDLENVTLRGGTLGGKGRIGTAAGNTDSTLNGVTIASGTTVTAAVGELDLTGTINAAGAEIDANSGSGISLDLKNVTLNGGTLGGSGKIATGAGNTDSTLNGVTLKSGTKVTAAVGTLDLTGTINATGAEIDANSGFGIAIDLESLTLIGATLGGLGVIATVSGVNTFNGVRIASGTTVTVTDNTALDLVGTIADLGTIALNATGDSTQLKITGSVVLNGGGHVTLTDSASNSIISDGLAATFNNFDTIAGAGTIGDGHLTLVNSGIIDATGSHALIIDTGANTSTTAAGPVGNILVTNNAGGVLEASAGHTLQIDDNVLNNGLIQAGNSGSNSAALVDITGNITGTGSIEIFNHATIEIGGSVSAGQTVTFESAGGAGLLILDDSHDFHGTIAGLTEFPTESLENHVDLKDLKFVSGHMSAHFSKGVVTISNGADSVSLKVSGAPDPAFELASDGSGGTLIDDPAAASGTVTIDSHTALDISGASTATVNFANGAGNTGELVLDDSRDFTGLVTGFAGDGTTDNSDLIDLKDINFANLSTETYVENAAGTGGTLTLSDGTTTTKINFAGDYVLDNFKFLTDGNGGTLVVDPPVASGEQFVFTPMIGSAPVQHVIADFDVNHDTIDLQGFSSAPTPSALLATATPENNGQDTLITIDPNDSILLKNVHLTSLHASDFVVHAV